MKYVQASNTGKGFVTNKDRELGHMSGHGANIYAVSDDHAEWILRVGGIEKTKLEAIDIVLTAHQSSWDNNNKENETEEQKIQRIGTRPISAQLPE